MRSAAKPAHRALVTSGLAALVLVSAGACRVAPGIRAPSSGDAAAEAEEVAFEPEVREITPGLVARKSQARRGDSSNLPSRRALEEDYAYRVGVGDVLTVIVWEHPELTNPAGVTTGGLEEQGRLVRDDGTLFFPLVGSVEAAGKAVQDIRRDIAEALSTYLDDPQVDVRVSEYRSQKVYVTGEVRQPGPTYLDDRPLTILDAISRAGGFGDAADRRRALLTREGDQRIIDILSLYESGAHDEVLQSGDILHVPDNHFNQVIVMGEVVDQTRVPLHEGHLSLAEAIAEAEGIELTTADTSRIVVIRGEPAYDDGGAVQGVRPIVYYLDGRDASDLLLAEGFLLEPRDIVFVPATTAVRFNRVIRQILPQFTSTLQAIWMTDRLIRD